MARRSRAREVVLQLLFQWDQNPTPVPRKAVARFVRDRLLADAVMEKYSLALLDGVVARKDAIDDALKAAATNWRLTRMTPVDRNVLRLGAYELLFDLSKPPLEVVINEAIELAKRFGSEDSPAFVNGVLDRIGKAPKSVGAERPTVQTQVSPAPPTPKPLDTPPAGPTTPPSPVPDAAETLAPRGQSLVHRIAYHNTERMGCSMSADNAYGVWTKKETKNWLGDVIWFVQGEGDNPRRYSLASVFVVDEMGTSGDDDLPNAAWGAQGHVFQPPIPLNQVEWFSSLREVMANFSLCPQRLTDPQLIRKLLILAAGREFVLGG